MSLPLPIDFNAIRTALVAIVQDGTGLDQNHVVMQQAETPLSARPTLPYVSLMFTTVAAKMGDDVYSSEGNSDAGMFNVGGQRMCSVAFDSYGRTHEEAYAYMHVLMCRLEQDPTLDALSAAGLAIWDYSSVVDMSALLSTGFEGRAHMDVQFGMASNMLVDLGQIDTVPIRGTVDTLSGTPLAVSVTTTIKGA